jgi:hypothetical protein
VSVVFSPLSRADRKEGSAEKVPEGVGTRSVPHVRATISKRKQGYTVTGIPYADYIRSAEWAEVKRRYRASKLPKKCVVCQNPNVDLHHKTYKRLGKEWLTDLAPLCRNHHTRVHDRVKSGKGGLWKGPRQLRKIEQKNRARRQKGKR